MIAIDFKCKAFVCILKTRSSNEYAKTICRFCLGCIETDKYFSALDSLLNLYRSKWCWNKIQCSQSVHVTSPVVIVRNNSHLKSSTNPWTPLSRLLRCSISEHVKTKRCTQARSRYGLNFFFFLFSFCDDYGNRTDYPCVFMHYQIYVFQ